PYMEQQAVHDIGLGMTGSALKTELTKQHAAALSVTICPSRRRAIVYPNVGGNGDANNTNPPPACAKTDYAANGGVSVQTFAGPGAGATEPALPSDWSIYNHTGLTHVISQVRPAHITDGLSGTYWVG